MVGDIFLIHTLFFKEHQMFYDLRFFRFEPENVLIMFLSCVV